MDEDTIHLCAGYARECRLQGAAPQMYTTLQDILTDIALLEHYTFEIRRKAQNIVSKIETGEA